MLTLAPAHLVDEFHDLLRHRDFFPMERRISVVASLENAALLEQLSLLLMNRFPGLDITVYPLSIDWQNWERTLLPVLAYQDLGEELLLTIPAPSFPSNDEIEEMLEIKVSFVSLHAKTLFDALLAE